MTTATKSNGASSRYVGRETEQAVARFLRQYWPDATRAVRTAWATRDGASDDPGDLHGVPFAVQVKGHKRGAPQFVPGKALAEIWEEANGQALTSGLPFAVIIEKRQGTQDVASWYAWLPVKLVAAFGYCAAMVGIPDGVRWDQFTPDMARDRGDTLVRMNVRDFVALIRAAGVPMGDQNDVATTGG